MIENNAKTATEIEVLVNQLEPIFQSYVLSTVNALLFSQQTFEKLSILENKNLINQYQTR